MSEKPYIIDFKEEDETFSLKELFSKYLGYWPWFLISAVCFLALGYAYAKYAPKNYYTEAKIKILDDTSEPKILPNNQAAVNPNLRLNLENHIEVIKSYRLLAGVVEALDLDVSIQKSGPLGATTIWNPPFYVRKIADEAYIDRPLKYEVGMTASGFTVTDSDGTLYIVPYNRDNTINDDLPFAITLGDIDHIKAFQDDNYKITVLPKKHAAMLLMEELQINTSEKQSDVLTLSLKGHSTKKNEAILDAIVNNFNTDNVEDKQLVAKRTLELIDKRFNDLSSELDSIELDKEDFKQLEDLSYIEADADVSLRRKSSSQQEVLRLETQQSLLGILRRSLNAEDDNNLLAADIGLANSALNNMVEKYNEMARERQKLMLSVGRDHPKLKNLSERLAYGKENIVKTVRVYESQLRSSLRQYNAERAQAGQSFAQIPEKERILRSIERQQNIKENLYLLLLRKREEAAIDYATTASSVKVVDYSLSGIKPIWPKKTIVYPVSLFLGLLLPLGIVFLRGAFDTKVHGKTEIAQLNPEIPSLLEIPYFGKSKKANTFIEGSALAESFRILSTNTDHLMPAQEGNGGKVIFVTSAIKEEGKTMMALNLSLAYASLGKKVLLVGGDLRNPQLHAYMDADRGAPGLSDYLKTPWFDFNDGLQRGFKNNPHHQVYLSGDIPESAPILLSNKRFAQFISDAKKEFDYVIMDTAPTMLVTDTLLISDHADATLFVLRAGVTDKNLLQFSKELYQNKKLKNMAYVINAVGSIKEKKYNYGYAYGYEA